MKSTLTIYNKKTEKSENYFFEELEKSFGAGKKCFNCDFCGDIITYTGDIKDSIIECLGKQSGVNNLHINGSCYSHKYIKDYFEIKKLN